MKGNNKLPLSERVSKIAFKLERTNALMEVLERALEDEIEIDHKKLVSISYIIEDYLQEITSEFNELEQIIIPED